MIGDTINDAQTMRGGAMMLANRYRIARASLYARLPEVVGSDSSHHHPRLSRLKRKLLSLGLGEKTSLNERSRFL